jgi:hypothetical protein
MKRPVRVLAAAGWLLAALPADVALAQKPGGILKMYDPDSPASMSIHEEGTIVSERPMIGVFNNLVMFDQHVKQNSLNSIVPDLATRWSVDLAAASRRRCTQRTRTMLGFPNGSALEWTLRRWRDEFAFLAPGSVNCPATSRASPARLSHSRASFNIDSIWSSLSRFVSCPFRSQNYVCVTKAASGGERKS